MDVSFIIPTFNGLDLLKVCLPAVLAQRFCGQSEIIVVDDGSRQDVPGFLAAHFPQVRCIRHPVNRGFAGAVNTGLAAATGRLVALVNNDTALDADWLAHAVRPFADGQVASVATRIVFMDEPDRLDSAGDEYTVVGGAMKTGHGGPVGALPTAEREVFSAAAAAAVYRRCCLEAVGGWDEALGAYYDDVDVGLRLRLAGFRCVYVHDAICCHRVSASYDPAGYRYHFNSSRNAELIWWASLPGPLICRYLVPHLTFLCMQAANKLLQGHLRPYLAGKLAALGRPGRIWRMRQRRQALRRASATQLREAMIRRWFVRYLRWRRQTRGR